MLKAQIAAMQEGGSSGNAGAYEAEIDFLKQKFSVEQQRLEEKIAQLETSDTYACSLLPDAPRTWRASASLAFARLAVPPLRSLVPRCSSLLCVDSGRAMSALQQKVDRMRLGAKDVLSCLPLHIYAMVRGDASSIFELSFGELGEIEQKIQAAGGANGGGPPTQPSGPPSGLAALDSATMAVRMQHPINPESRTRIS